MSDTENLDPFLALYFDDNKPTLTVNLDAGPPNPRQIGIALADTITAVAKSMVDSGLTKNDVDQTVDDVRDEIVEWVRRELEEPTDDIEIMRLS